MPRCSWQPPTDRGWRGHVGLVTDAIDQAEFDPWQCTVLVCGPERMILAGVDRLLARGVPTGDIWVSLERLRAIRETTRYLIPIGACATAGGPQALRNLADSAAWLAGVYPHPELLKILPTATRIADHVPVDLELPGCPVNTRQVLAAVRSLLFGAPPVEDCEKVCIECKRQGHVCVLVARGEPCLGPVTATGCGALCPGLGRDCYGCYGPAENANIASLGGWLAAGGMAADAVAHRFLYQNSGHPVFRTAAQAWLEQADD